MTDFHTNCSVCNKPLGGRHRFKESRVDIFRPVVEDGKIVCFADRHLALCKSCTQSLYSWMNNRRKKHQEFSEKHDIINPQFLSKVANLNKEMEDN